MMVTVFNGETPRYCVVNPDGTYAGVFCVSYAEALELASCQEGRVIYRLTEVA